LPIATDLVSTTIANALNSAIVDTLTASLINSLKVVLPCGLLGADLDLQLLTIDLPAHVQVKRRPSDFSSSAATGTLPIGVEIGDRTPVTTPTHNTTVTTPTASITVR
jgi:hypothetical protein